MLNKDEVLSKTENSAELSDEEIAAAAGGDSSWTHTYIAPGAGMRTHTYIPPGAGMRFIKPDEIRHDRYVIESSVIDGTQKYIVWDLHQGVDIETGTDLQYLKDKYGIK